MAKRRPVAVLTQHPDQHLSEDPILLAADQQLREGAALRVRPELADPLGQFDVGSARL